ncbi:MAG: UDP-N-acetylmuramoyl-L-alanyl-D-glutamate--2,6-diaminopimelate ligase, partial [Candidatus Eremiobacteraeota bacterium]|nr:UDP-N-acetylmuramoyl-L-alanyl-D-glutamate--2,6-diaminopimelate ligase [Candidatus Eremiobacteraeota bacterium]
ALAVARILHIDPVIAAQGLAQLDPVRGRMEHVGAHGLDVIVDYAHTPDALQNALRTLRETTSGKLIVVFGAGGDRDRGKRPQMGKVASELADTVIVTSDNPRSEEPGEIARDILAGIGARPYQLILDRREAIHAAISQAHDRDVVLIAGKGHESYQILSNQTLSFDDRAVAQEALAARAQESL